MKKLEQPKKAKKASDGDKATPGDGGKEEEEEEEDGKGGVGGLMIVKSAGEAWKKLQERLKDAPIIQVNGRPLTLCLDSADHPRLQGSKLLTVSSFCAFRGEAKLREQWVATTWISPRMIRFHISLLYVCTFSRFAGRIYWEQVGWLQQVA